MQRAPVGVHDLFAPVEHVCASCGARSVTSGRACPNCGTPYVNRRVKVFGTRRRKLILAGGLLGLAALVALGALLLAPGIDRAKRAHATAAQRADAAAQARLIARARAEQALRLASGRIRDPGPGAASSARVSARTALVHELQTSITVDTRARVRAGILTGPVLFTTCSPYQADAPPPQTTLTASIGAYSCLAVNRPVKDQHGTVGEFGDPFWARIDFARGRFAWCKINPLPGEEAVGGGAPVVPLAAACDLSRAAPAVLG